MRSCSSTTAGWLRPGRRPAPWRAVRGRWRGRARHPWRRPRPPRRGVPGRRGRCRSPFPSCESVGRPLCSSCNPAAVTTIARAQLVLEVVRPVHPVLVVVAQDVVGAGHHAPCTARAETAGNHLREQLRPLGAPPLLGLGALRRRHLSEASPTGASDNCPTAGGGGGLLDARRKSRSGQQALAGSTNQANAALVGKED